MNYFLIHPFFQLPDFRLVDFYFFYFKHLLEKSFADSNLFFIFSIRRILLSNVMSSLLNNRVCNS